MMYTGIGSRQTPAIILQVFERIAELLAGKGYTLRSGGADGADDAFEKGCLRAGGSKEIYLPWSGFNGRSEKNDGYFFTRASHYDLYKKAKGIAALYHPLWDQLSDGVKKLHTRNVHQVLGLDVETPSTFVICYTEEDGQGGWRGGTGQALRIARERIVPIYNFANDSNVEECMKMLKSL